MTEIEPTASSGKLRCDIIDLSSRSMHAAAMKKPVKIALWCLVALCVLTAVVTHFAGPRVARGMPTDDLEPADGQFFAIIDQSDPVLWGR